MSYPAMAARSAPVLSGARLAQLRELLEQHRAFRLDQLDQLQRSADLGLAGDVDREIASALAAGARAALADVLDALHRMADGSYGTCRQCGAALAVERLEVLPQLALCMHCQQVAESR